MNHECLTEPENNIWSSCQIVDSTTSPTHVFVRAETNQGVKHYWIRNERVRAIDNSGTEPSH